MFHRLLTMIALLLAVAMLGLGLVRGGYIAGRDEWLDPEAAPVLLIGGGTMLIAAVTLHAFPWMAAVEMALTGLMAVAVGTIDAAQRSLVTYGAIALVLAVAAMVLEMQAPGTRPHPQTRIPYHVEHRQRGAPPWER